MKKTLALFLAAALAASAIGGCTSKPAAQSSSDAGTQSNTSSTPNAAITYPLAEKPTFSYWIELHANISAFAKNYSETEYAKKLEELTGVHINYEHPAAGQAKESLNVLLTSGDYPDLVSYDFQTNYTGGSAKLYNDGIIYKLNDYLEKDVPALAKYYKENADIARQAKTDNGDYYLFPMIMDGPALANTSGPMLRKDLLQKAGLSVPETIDEWEAALTAFKNQGVESPYVAQGMATLNDAFVRAFDVSNLFYPVNKVVKFGPCESGYKDYIKKMADWYSKGLIDRNFSTNDRKAIDSAMTTGKAAATRGAGGGQMGQYIPTGKKADANYNLVATKLPTLKKGTDAKYAGPFEYRTTGNVVVTKSCKNVDAAMKYMNYFYTDEGRMYTNFGTENVTYKMVNGYPTYTDVITKDATKSFAQSLSNYTLANMSNSFIQDTRYIEQYYTLDEQKDALKLWSQYDKDNRMLPPISMTPEESSEFSKIMVDINTLVDEMSLKYIMGTEPLTTYDDFVKRIKGMNIDRAIALQQAALDRYYKR